MKESILATVSFFAIHKDWHSFCNDRKTMSDIKFLEKKKFLIVDWHTLQARHTGKVFI